MTSTTDNPSIVGGEDYLGLGICPECGRYDGYLNIGRGQWFYCTEHHTCWLAGENLFSSWRFETEAEQRARYDALDFDTYRQVEP